MATQKGVNLLPIGDRLLVERVDERDVTPGGIIIPDNAKDKPQEGLVIAVGVGKLDDSGKVIPMQVRAGARILFGKYSGTEITVNGRALLLMKEEEVLAAILTDAEFSEVEKVGRATFAVADSAKGASTIVG
jgi:chaperonin GroES